MQTEHWNGVPPTCEGVVLGATDGDEPSLKFIKEHIWKAEELGILSGRNHCLEFCVGGPLRLYEEVLIDIFEKIDINEQSPKQMRQTYIAEEDIDKKRKDYMVGKIAHRFEMNMLDVWSDTPYNLLIGRWAINYL